MNSEDSKKSCYNCKYFKNYYVKDKTGFRKIQFGYCLNRDFKIKDRRKNFPYIMGCELWENKTSDLAETKQNIENVIYEISDRLNQLVFLLKE